MHGATAIPSASRTAEPYVFVRATAAIMHADGTQCTARTIVTGSMPCHMDTSDT